MNKRNIFLIILIIVAVGCLFLLINKKPEKKQDQNPNTNIANQNSNQELPVGNSDAKSHYENGLTLFDRKSYEEAILEFNQAIAIDTVEPNYYSKKAQAQSNLGRTQDAINTINEGLKYNPDSDLLKTRLDILQRDWIGSQEQ